MSNYREKRRAARRASKSTKRGRTLRFEDLEGRLMMTSSPISLPVGEIVADSISRPGEIDQFVFQGEKREVVQLVVTRTSGSGWFKPYIEVYGPSDSHTPIKAFWHDRDEQFRLREKGRYLVKVYDDNLQDTGRYKIGLEKVNPPSPKPVALVEGGIIERKIQQSLQKDQLVFSGKKGEVVQLVVTRTAGDMHFKPHITVYAPSNTGNSMQRFWHDEDKQFTLPRDGTYLVQVRDDNLTDLGAYKIGLEKVNPPSPKPIALLEGGIIERRIRQSLQKDQFVFQGKKGEVIQLVMTRTAGDIHFKPYITVYAPSNTGDSIQEFWHDRDTQFTLPRDGTYLVQVRDDNLTDLGAYKIGLEKVNPPSPKPIALPEGGIIERKIQQSLQKDQFVFQGRKGEVVQLVTTRTAGDMHFKPYITVYAPSNTGDSIQEFWHDRDTQFILPRKGTYLVQVQDDNLTDLGAYKIGFEKLNPASANPIVLSAGSTLERRIIESLQKDQFVFQGREGQMVELIVKRTSGNMHFKPFIKVYAQPNTGDSIQAFWHDRTIRFRLPKDGSYLVQVQDDNLVDLGDYQITLRF